MGGFVLYCSRMKQNPLLGRKQCNIQLIHPEKANVSKKEIKEALAKKLKSSDDRISVFGIKTQFGGGRSSGFALIYNSTEEKAKYDSETLLRRWTQEEASCWQKAKEGNQVQTKESQGHCKG